MQGKTCTEICADSSNMRHVCRVNQERRRAKRERSCTSEEGERTDRGFLKKEERRGISSSNFLGNGKRRGRARGTVHAGAREWCR